MKRLVRPGNLVPLLVCLSIVVAWSLWFRPASLGGPASYILVSGNSMATALHKGDLVVTQKQDSYGVGDIVVFYMRGGTVIHRIVGGSTEEGFITQGDNNEGVDPWRLRPENIVGKQWLRFPGGSRWLLNLRQPISLGILVGGLSAFSLFGGSEVRRRRRGGRHMRANGNPSIGSGIWTGGGSGQMPAPWWLLGALAVAVVLVIGVAAAAVYSFRQETQKTETVERLRYEQTAAFDYTVQVQPSSLYPSGVIGPVVAPPVPPTSSGQARSAAEGPPNAQATVTSPPIYTKAARSLDLVFNYNLKGSLPAAVSGEYSADLQIKAGENGWTKTLPLLPSTAFSGPQTSFRTTLNFAQIWAIIDAVEKETDFKPGAYDLSVIPTLHIKGSVGPEAVDEVYAPPFTLKLTRTQITPDGELARSQIRTFTDTMTSRSVSVTMARWASVGGTAIALALAAVLAAVVFLGLGRDEAAKIRARHGSIIIDVAQADLKADTQKIQLTSMHDLVRLAQRDGQIILHQEVAPGSHRYFVQDTTVTFEYTAAGPAEEA